MLSLKRFGALIRRWLWTLVGNELDWDIQVQIPWEEIPPARLGDIAVLGRNVWLLGREHQGICDDPVFSLSYA
jgi:predicted component of type VI protein secretion system